LSGENASTPIHIPEYVQFLSGFPFFSLETAVVSQSRV
jgi:hypothetical protein